MDARLGPRRPEPGGALARAVADAGELATAYEAIVAGSTVLGPETSWSDPLRRALALVLPTRFPACVFWGPDLVMLYNSAFVTIIEEKHPGALGSAARDVFPEIWDTIGPMLHSVMAGRGSTWVEDARLLMSRRGFLEECFFTFSYSPLAEADGRVGGVLDIAVETTTQVVDRRRLELLAALGLQLHDLDSPSDLVQRSLPVLRRATRDLADADIVDLRALVESGARVPAWRAADSVALDAGPDGTLARFRLSGGGAAGEQVLQVRLSDHLPHDGSYLEFLRLVAATLGTASAEATARELERRSARADRAMSEALQRSMLTEARSVDLLEIAARYVPATRDAQVGGDWYDSFSTSAGITCLVVGDVAGHDQHAAAVMGQIRNLLRGVGYALAQPPAAILSVVDHAMTDLAVDALATALLAQVEHVDGEVRLRWTNAGHPPPVLLDPDGSVRLLATEADLLLGLDPGTARADHSEPLTPGSVLLLYTDGLVERRDDSIDAGLQWLAATVAGLAGLSLDEMCDALLARVQTHAEDDIALLAVRVRPPELTAP